MRLRKITSDSVTLGINTNKPTFVMDISIDSYNSAFVLDEEFKVRRVKGPGAARIPLFHSKNNEDIEAFLSTNLATEKIEVTKGKYKDMVGYWVLSPNKEKVPKL